MAKPVSDEKRADIVRHMEAGKSMAEIARWLFLCPHTVGRVCRKYRETGGYGPEPRNCGRKPLVSAETMGLVVSRVREAPDTTLAELIALFGLTISEGALSRRLTALGFTYKKKLSVRVAAAGPTSQRRGTHGGRGGKG
jgi:transposase